MEQTKQYPGHIELKLDKKTGEVFEEFIPDDNYIYVFTGTCDRRPGAMFIDAVAPPDGEDNKNGRRDGMFYGYPSVERRYPYRKIVTLYPYRSCGEGMHEALFTKRIIEAGRVVTEAYYRDRYGCRYDNYW